MPWTYAQIKAADAALSPAIPDIAASAAALNAQTTTLTQPSNAVSVASIHGNLLLASTGDWLKVEALAAEAYSSGYPMSPTANDNAINAAKLATTLASSKVDGIDPADWSAFLAQLQVLVTNGAVAQQTQNQIVALAVTTIPAWSPPLTAGDVQTARAQP
jgi:hypothetical protein